MKKKLASIFGIVLAFSILNLNALTLNDPYECWDIADATEACFNTVSVMNKNIPTAQQSFNVWSSAFDNCMGYE